MNLFIMKTNNLTKQHNGNSKLYFKFEFFCKTFYFYFFLRQTFQNISIKFKLFDRQDSTKIGIKENMPTYKNNKQLENYGAVECSKSANGRRNSHLVQKSVSLTDKRNCPEFIEFQNFMKHFNEDNMNDFSSSNENEQKSLSFCQKNKKSSVCSNSCYCENWFKGVIEPMCPKCSKTSTNSIRFSKKVPQHDDKHGLISNATNNNITSNSNNTRRHSQFNRFIPNVYVYENYNEEAEVAKGGDLFVKSMVLVNNTAGQYSSRKRSMIEYSFSNLILDKEKRLTNKENTKLHKIYHKDDNLNFL